jgi:hypothetical protein
MSCCTERENRKGFKAILAERILEILLQITNLFSLHAFVSTFLLEKLQRAWISSLIQVIGMLNVPHI